MVIARLTIIVLAVIEGVWAVHAAILVAVLTLV